MQKRAKRGSNVTPSVSEPMISRVTLAEPAAAMLDSRHTVLVIASHVSDQQRLKQLVDGAGLRALAIVTPEEAMKRLDQTIALDLLLVDAPAASWSDTFQSLLVRFDQMARMGDATLIVNADTQTIDRVFALIEAPHAQVLCDASPVELAVAISVALSPSAGPLLVDFHDIGRDSEAALRLARIGEEVTRLALTLAGDFPAPHAAAEPWPDHQATYMAETPSTNATPPPVSAAAVRRMLRIRRLRDQMFPEGLFADPAWDMLLDLTAARLEGEKVSVSSLCIAAAVPPTTALRWIRNLTEHGIFERHADFQDGRRVFITLSDSAFMAMNAYFNASHRIRHMPA